MFILIGIVSLVWAGSTFAVPEGPVYPPPGGCLFKQDPDDGSAGDEGGVDFIFTNFDPTAFSELFWGISSEAPPEQAVGAGLDGNLYPLSFVGATSESAQWFAADLPYPYLDITVDVRFTLTMVSEEVSLILAETVGLDDLGAVVDNSAGKDFTVNLFFEANIDDVWVPINTLEQYPDDPDPTQTSFEGGFYYVFNPNGYIHGIVTDVDTAEPIERALVLAIQLPSKDKFFAPFTNEDGYYEILDLAPGLYLVIAIKQGYNPGVKIAKVVAGEGTWVEFPLTPTLE
jgi:hypothetical protein